MLTFALIAAALVVCWPRRKTKRRKRSAVSPAQQRKARDRAMKEAEKAEAKRKKDAAARAQAAEDIPYSTRFVFLALSPPLIPFTCGSVMCDSSTNSTKSSGK